MELPALDASAPLPVMVVDDEVENLQLMERTLFPRFQVQAFTDARPALAALAEQRFSVVVSDNRMPGMSGVEFLTRVCEMAPETVRIMVTGYADLDTALDAVNRGRVSAILRKPVDMPVFSAEVELCLGYYRLQSTNQQLLRNLAQSNSELFEAKHLLELNLDARGRELMQANARLEDLVVRDGLTGLFNHRHFQERCEQEVASALRHGYPLSLLFMDVDHFKALNDRCGHPAGDRMLLEIARILKDSSSHHDQTLRHEDLVARYGGEEFVLLLPHTPREGAEVVAQRIRLAVNACSAPEALGQPLGALSLSVGVAELPRDASTKEELIARADAAVLAAKSAGRNCVVQAHDLVKRTAPVTTTPPDNARTPERASVLLERALQRERIVREQTDRLLEDKTRSLYLANQQLREQQAVLVETEKMGALGRMSAGVAHEINNALNFMRGNIQHLPRYLDTYQELLAAYRAALANDPEVAGRLRQLEEHKRLDFVVADMPKLLSAMGTGLERASAIVRDLGVFVRSDDAADMVLTPVSAPLSVALTLASNRLRHRVKVNQELLNTPPVLCHPGRVSQVFLNLLLNAADAIENEGEISIKIYPREDMVMTSLRDTGSGMAREQHARIFEPFFTTKAPGSGTGLGLFMCKKILDDHGGAIWCDSKPGAGTTFFVSLPVAGPPKRKTTLPKTETA